MPRPKALTEISYLGYTIKEKSFRLMRPVNLRNDEKGYLKQGSQFDTVFAHKENSSANNPDIFIYKIHHSAMAMSQEGKEPSKNDPVIFKIDIGIEMIYETPPLNKGDQKKIKASDWYFKDCAKPVIQIILSELMTDTGYKMR